MAAKIGSLHVNLDLDTARFQAGLQKSQSQLSGFQAGMARVAKAVGGLMVADALVGIASNAFEMASSMSEAATRVGLSVEALQELRVAANASGVSNEQLESSMGRLNVALGDLQAGGKSATSAFERIGLSAADLKGKNPQEALSLIADELMEIEDPAARAAAAQDLFGKSYAQMLPMLQGGAAGLAEAAKQSREHGQLSTENAQKLDDLADSWDKFKTDALIGVANAMPVVIDAFERVGDEMDRTRKESYDAGQAIREAFEKNVGPIRISSGTIQGAIASLTANMLVSLGGLASKVTAHLSRIGPQMLAIGRDIVAGLARGISNSADMAIAAARRLASSLPEWVRDVLGIQSPSRVFMEIGDYIGQGLAVGMEGTRSRVAAAAKGMTEAARKAAQETAALLNRLFPEIERASAYRRELGMIEGSGLSDANKSEARRRLAYEAEGIEGGAEIKALGQGSLVDTDQITRQLETFRRSVEGTADSSEVQTVRIAKSFKDMTDEVIGSLRGLIDGIKKGDILSIVEGIAGVFQTLAGAGLFGKTVQGRVQNFKGFRALGGPVEAGGTYMVGERGPEFFTPKSSGFIHPNGSMPAAGALTLGISPSPLFHVYARDQAGRVVAESSPGIARSTASGIQSNWQAEGLRTLPG